MFILYGVARSVINQGNSHTLIDTAYEEYQKVCEEYQQFCRDLYTNYPDPELYLDYKDLIFTPVSIKNFEEHIHRLSLLKLIRYQGSREKDSSYSTSLEISLIDISARRLSVLIKKVIDNMHIRPG